MFHLEIYERPNTARAFNMTEQELVARFLGPYLAGQTLEFQDREWDPKHSRLKIVEGPELATNQIGMGRGWQNVEKRGTDVTQAVLTRARLQQRNPSLDRLKERLVGRLGAGPVALGAVIALADDLMVGHRASERLGLAELAIWELLHESAGRLELLPEETIVPPEQWQELLLAWQTWAELPPRAQLASLPRD